MTWGGPPEPDPARRSPQDVHGWYEARDAVNALRDVVVAAGLAKHLPYLRADLNAFGRGIIEIGRTTPEGALRIAELLALGLGVPVRIEASDPERDAGIGTDERGTS
jgi:hypothetical protein